MIQLRTYQTSAIAEIRKHFAAGRRRVLFVLPTGGGKTVTFAYMALEAAAKQKRVLIVTDRIELLSQAGGTLAKFGIIATKINAQTKSNPNQLPGYVFTAMAETLKRRINMPSYEKFLQSFDLIIFDEAHKQSFSKLLAVCNEKSFIIGATATPWRGGATAIPLAKEYDAMINAAEVLDLIGNGSLVDAVAYGAPIDLAGVHTKAGEYDEKELFEKYNKRELYAGVVEKYNTHAPNTKALVFCINVKHSILTAQAFNAAGISARHLDAESEPAKRAQTLSDFKAGAFKVLCNVGLFTTGYDEPSIETIILDRATKSLSLFLQMCGRGSRPYENKPNFTIIDMGNNIFEHGFWQQNRAEQWAKTFQGSTKKKSDKKQAPNIFYCENCGAILAVGVKMCPMCLTIVPPKERAIVEATKQAEFVKLEWSEMPAHLKGRSFKELAPAELEEVRNLRGYKLGWLIRQLGTVERLKEYADLKGYKPGFVFKNMQFVN